MRIVVDANVVFAALVKSSITRELLLYPFISYYSPDFLLDELQKHKEELLAKSGLSKRAHGKVLKLILSNIKVLPRLNYRSEIRKAFDVMGRFDKADVAYVALAIAIKADGIWSYDRHFERQQIIKTLGTADVAAVVWRGRKA